MTASLPSPPAGKRRLVVATVLFAAAAGLSLLLARDALEGHVPPVGCGGAQDCGAIAATRWAYWGPLPVILPAVAVYLATLGGLLALPPLQAAGKGAQARRVWGGLATLGLVTLGAALWFAAIQAFVLRRYCPLCLATHGCAVLGSVLILRLAPGPAWKRGPALSAAGALTLLIGGQLGWAAAPPAVLGNAPAPASVRSWVLPSREITLAGGRVRLDAAAFPALASSPAPAHVAAVMLDYTCAACRAQHPAWTAALAQRGAAWAFLLILAPLDPACNPAIDRLRPDHANACRYARYALAVWKAAPEKFAGYDAWLMAGAAPPDVNEARERAQTLVGAEALERALRSADVERALSKASKMYRALDAGEIPKTLLPRGVVSERIGSRAQLESILEKAEPGRQ